MYPTLVPCPDAVPAFGSLIVVNLPSQSVNPCCTPLESK